MLFGVGGKHREKMRDNKNDRSDEVKHEHATHTYQMQSMEHLTMKMHSTHLIHKMKLMPLETIEMRK